MVVRIEPLLHREGLDVTLGSLVAVGRGKIGLEGGKAEFLVTGRNGTEQESRIENVVVEREIVGRNERDAGSLLLLPTVLADFSGSFLEFRFGNFTLKELFTSKLEFASLANARETDNRCFLCTHSVLPTFFTCYFVRSQIYPLF